MAPSSSLLWLLATTSHDDYHSHKIPSNFDWGQKKKQIAHANNETEKEKFTVI